MEKRNSFSSSLGFVLAVGLGNIWRFPYLAAKDGGGLFLAIYIVLALTFGFTMIVTETAIGRKTKQSALTAYGAIHKKSKWIGVFACLVPFMILPYYCIIGGWVLKYTVTFISGNGVAAAQDGYFTGFITDTFPPIIFEVEMIRQRGPIGTGKALASVGGEKAVSCEITFIVTDAEKSE